FEHFAGPAGRAGGGGQADGRPGLAGAIGCGFHVEFDVRGPVSVVEKARERLRKQVEVVCPLLRTNPVDDDDSAANAQRAPPRDAYAGVRGTSMNKFTITDATVDCSPRRACRLARVGWQC